VLQSVLIDEIRPRCGTGIESADNCLSLKSLAPHYREQLAQRKAKEESEAWIFDQTQNIGEYVGFS
jgi:hypothetical protein